MKKLLVTGASGFLGWQVCAAAPKQWSIVATSQSRREAVYPKTPYLPCDLREKDATWRLLKAVKPDAVFHLAAFSNTNYCEKHPEESRQLNVAATARLAEMCAERNIRLVFTSSEQVYDGSAEHYAESDESKPRNEYGRQKLAAEGQIFEALPGACAVRIAVMFGQAHPSSPSFLQQWLEHWQQMLPVTAFHDEHRSFMSGEMAADGLFFLLGKDAEGVFNLSGATAHSRYDFALLSRGIFNLKNAIVRKSAQKDVEMAASRPPNLVLDNSKIEALGFSPRAAEAELRALAKRMILPPQTSLAN